MRQSKREVPTLYFKMLTLRCEEVWNDRFL